jgi:hypothetical protein
MTSSHVLPAVFALICFFLVGSPVEGGVIHPDCHLNCPYGRLTVDGVKLCECGPNPCDLFRDVASCENVAFLDEDDEDDSSNDHRRMARGGHGLSKVSTSPGMPYSSMSYGRATPETDLRPFQRWPACRAGGLRPSSTPLDTPCHTPMK